MKTKYLCISEWPPEDWNTVLERDTLIQADREMNPGKYPKKPIESCFLHGELPKLTESFRSIDIYEADDPEQLTNLAAFWDAQKLDMKSTKRWFIPLSDFVPYVTEFRRQRERVEKMKEQTKTTR